uniref:Uncharacterized protein n=1 Tax=Trichogramma kaykai TaxID=54128 RepID=A0ABD2XEM0_9HYME
MFFDTDEFLAVLDITPSAWNIQHFQISIDFPCSSLPLTLPLDGKYLNLRIPASGKLICKSYWRYYGSGSSRRTTTTTTTSETRLQEHRQKSQARYMEAEHGTNYARSTTRSSAFGHRVLLILINYISWVCI